MALKTTVVQMKKLLAGISSDLEKAENGNRAAAQRVRTNTIKFAKVAKTFRKESIADKGKKKAKKAAPKRKAAAKKKAAPKRKAAKKKPAAKKKAVKRKVVRKKKAAPKRKTAARRKRR
ncbi:MAG: Histone H1-like protein HC1 [Chlamydiae bacterium]|nr:Histone H1-like protein HC1 [Chlamydiota bacterium]